MDSEIHGFLKLTLIILDCQNNIITLIDIMSREKRKRLICEYVSMQNVGI